MRSLIAALIILAVMVIGSPAMAYLAVISTTVPVTNADDEAELKTAVDSAVKDVLAHAIAFTPTVIVLERARLVGSGLQLVLLIADADGEKSIEAFSAQASPPEEPADLSGRDHSRLNF